MSRRTSTIALIGLLMLPHGVSAQAIGGSVPAYKDPVRVAPPVRSMPGDDAPYDAPPPAENPFGAQDDVVAQFTDAYRQGGKPRLAFYWNRQLSETLDQWYSDTRVVSTSKRDSSTSGDFNLTESSQSQKTLEVQRRTPTDDSRRMQQGETWVWEFQDGFLGPFLQAGASVLDRTAIIRITGADSRDSDAMTIETRALQGMADMLVEVLVAPSAPSSSGYELRARILEVRTGRIVAYVNSRGLKEWQKTKGVVATSRGFQLPEEDDDDSFGPDSAEGQLRATSTGFQSKRKPPKLQMISQNLAYNVMKGMMPQLGGTPVPANKTPVAAKVAPQPVGSMAVSNSAVPRSDVEAQLLTPPATPSRPSEEPPMPRATSQ
ncbi:conserved exported hypothetical protein [Candidatus Terasakiella magnetica]|nr:conserved exported hypothetical protein [Candidatus Terasakiella magnetica]